MIIFFYAQVMVQDPELITHLQMTQAELEATKRQLMAMLKDRTSLRDENTRLQSEVSDRDQRNRKLVVENTELHRLLLLERDKQPLEVSTDLERGSIYYVFNSTCTNKVDAFSCSILFDQEQVILNIWS